MKKTIIVCAKVVRSCLPCLLLLLLAGCGMFSGGGGDQVLMVDGEQAFETTLKPGETLVLDMRDPGSGGYEFVGAVFDPAVLELEKYWQEPADSGMAGDFGRAKYVFRAVNQGKTTVEIRIRRPFEKNSAPEVYKSVFVLVE